MAPPPRTWSPHELVAAPYHVALLDSTPSPALVADVRQRVLHGPGVATLEGFLSDEALADALADARRRAPHAFTSRSRHNVYLLPAPDPSLPQEHVRNRLLETTVASVACDELDPHGALHALYFGRAGDQLLELVSQATGQRLYKLDDPLGALSINVFRPGMQHAYHFDESLYTITLCLQKAQRGGQFIFSPPLRTLQTQLAQDAVEHILETGHGVQELAFEPGTISIFCGQRSLHRVAQVHGHLDRLVAVLCYANCKGVRNSQDVQKQFWGRARM